MNIVNYNHNHGTSSLKKHVDMAHPLVLERYVKEAIEKHVL